MITLCTLKEKMALVRLALALEVIVLVGLVGCARGPEPSFKRFYQGLAEPAESVDVTGLKNTRIVIDPGHGGVFRGARGPGGLEEADVNLAVALRLEEMLEQAGAEVTLTRDADRDFVGGDSLRLRDDLKARVDVANRIDPDVFMSLHHNADLKGDPATNEIQVYYKVWDDGPSLDAARAIASHLRRNLGEDRARIVGGNYHVLRNSVAPAVLCEPSFITNPETEARLRLDENRRLEAATYFVALADYLSRGVPRVIALGASRCGGADSSQARPAIEVGFDAGTVIDPASLDIILDGAPMAPAPVGPNRFAALPADDLAGGLHLVRARGRALTGNSSREASAQFEVASEPAALTLSVDPAVADGVHPQRITACALDRNRNPVADSTPVVFSWGEASEARLTRAGEATIYAGRDVPHGAAVRARCRSLEASVALEVADGASQRPPAYVSGFVLDSAGRPVEGATVRGDEPRSPALTEPHSSAVTDAQGFFLLACEPIPSRLVVFRRGFRGGRADLAPGQYPTVRLARFYSGLDPTRGAVIDVDDRPGASAPAGVAESPARRFNLAVALKLRDLLEAAGVRAAPTAAADETITDEVRLKRTEAFGPALVVSISSRVEGATSSAVSHYPNSGSGEAIAKLVAEELGRFQETSVPISETADYMIQQPSCAAVRVELAAEAWVAPGAEAQAADVWQAAEALMCAVVRYLGVDRAQTVSLVVRVAERGRAAAGCLVTVDAALQAVTDEDGEAVFAMVEPGPHALEALSATGATRSLELESGRRSVEVTLD